MMVTEVEETEEADPADGSVCLVAALSESAAIDLLEAALPHASHLRPLWERILVGPYEGRTAVGIPITAKVTQDTVENHSRHLYSLLNLLGVPLVTSPMMLEQIEVLRTDLRPLKGPASAAAKKAEAKKAEAAAAAAAAAAAEGESAEAAEDSAEDSADSS